MSGWFWGKPIWDPKAVPEGFHIFVPLIPSVANKIKKKSHQNNWNLNLITL